MRVRSPRSIPTYKDKFQPQPRARGSEVDATRNLLGAGMGLGSTRPRHLFQEHFLFPA